MTPPPNNDDRLADLRRRWEEDPGSRIFLQLAEEYRRTDRLDEALEVLEKGLEAHPKQVSGLVLLGRVQIERGRPEAAAAVLDRALDIDATNAVAMKLAVEASLRLDNRDVARQRLELYKLLNATDPEIAELEARIAGQGGGGAGGDAPPADADGDDTVPGGGGPEAELPAAWSATAAWPGLPRGGAAPGEEAAPDPHPHPSGPEPFAALGTGEERRRYLEALGAEGIFPVDLEPVPEPEAEVPHRPPPSPDFEDAPGAPGEETAGHGGGWREPSPSTPAGVPTGDRPTVTLGQLYLEQGHPGEALRIFEAVLERNPDSAQARTGLLRARAGLAEESAPPPDGGSREMDPGGVPPGDLDDWEQPATAARHLEEAVPPVEPATGGLGAGYPEAAPVAEGPPPPLTAADLLAGADPEQSPRRALLHAYLDRLRRGRGE